MKALGPPHRLTNAWDSAAYDYQRQTSSNKLRHHKDRLAKQAEANVTGNATALRSVSARERAKAAQHGDSPTHKSSQVSSEPVITPRRKAMQSDFALEKRPGRSSSPSTELPGPRPFQKPRASGRLQSKSNEIRYEEPEVNQWSKQNRLPVWDGPLIYPAIGSNRTYVDVTDIERLDEGEFLNDNIISFSLRRLEESHSDLKKRVHIFNTFFYTTLSTKNGKKAFNYDAVKRWTKSIDIFSYPFVVVPVNANFQWFVTIICNLDKLDRDLVEEPSDSATHASDMLDSKLDTITGPGDELPMELPDSQEELNAEIVRHRVDRLSLSESDISKAHAVVDIEPLDSLLTPVPTEQVAQPARVQPRNGKRRAPAPQKYKPSQLVSS